MASNDGTVTAAIPAAPGTRAARRRDAIANWRIAGMVLPFALLALVEVLVRSGVLPSHLVPAPSEIIAAFSNMGVTRLARHMLASTSRVFAGFALGAGLAVVLGAAMGLSRRFEALMDPLFQALRAIPSLAWVPVLLLWMGIDEAPKVTLVAIGAFFPVHLSVVAGIHNVDRKLVELGTVLRLGRVALVRRILLPAALPHILTGFRTGMGVAWMFVVAAELIAATRGLGYLLSDGRETGRVDLVFGAIVLFGVLGKASDSALKWVERRCLQWRDTVDENHTADEGSP